MFVGFWLHAPSIPQWLFHSMLQRYSIIIRVLPVASWKRKAKNKGEENTRVPVRLTED